MRTGFVFGDLPECEVCGAPCLRRWCSETCEAEAERERGEEPGPIAGGSGSSLARWVEAVLLVVVLAACVVGRPGAAVVALALVIPCLLVDGLVEMRRTAVRS